MIEFVFGFFFEWAKFWQFDRLKNISFVRSGSDHGWKSNWQWMTLIDAFITLSATSRKKNIAAISRCNFASNVFYGYWCPYCWCQILKVNVFWLQLLLRLKHKVLIKAFPNSRKVAKFYVSIFQVLCSIDEIFICSILPQIQVFVCHVVSTGWVHNIWHFKIEFRIKLQCSQ